MFNQGDINQVTWSKNCCLCSHVQILQDIQIWSTRCIKYLCCFQSVSPFPSFSVAQSAPVATIPWSILQTWWQTVANPKDGGDGVQGLDVQPASHWKRGLLLASLVTSSSWWAGSPTPWFSFHQNHNYQCNETPLSPTLLVPPYPSPPPPASPRACPSPLSLCIRHPTLCPPAGRHWFTDSWKTVIAVLARPLSGKSTPAWKKSVNALTSVTD